MDCRGASRAIKIELPARCGHTDEALAFIREMGVESLNPNAMPDRANEKDMTAKAGRPVLYPNDPPRPSLGGVASRIYKNKATQ